MRSFSTSIILALLATASNVIAAPSCAAGEGLNLRGTACHLCPPGSFSHGGMVLCSPCPAGQGSDQGASACTTCIAGTFSTGGTACTNCPAGTASHTDGAIFCTYCGVGSFAPAGSKGCCTCCAGFKCPDVTNGHATKCASGRGSDFGSGTCDNGVHLLQTSSCAASNGFCPAVTQLGPSSVPTKKRAVHCTRGYTTCPHWSGRGGMDCIDTRSNVESCGGCVSVSPEDAGEGTDCTAIPGVSIANCVRSQCVVESCRKGYQIAEDGRSCVRPSGHREVAAIADMFFPHKARRSRS